MGRYYEGDIEGKFWFGVQSSVAADRFGVHYTEPNYVDYYFDKEDLPKVEKELTNIENTVGKNNIKKLNNFFDTTCGYNDKILKEHNVYEIWEKYKVDYADYLLGIKIRDCIKEQGYCSFTAEL